MGTMVTPATPPIDLYEESTDALDHTQDQRPTGPRTMPSQNGELDQPAIDAGRGRWDQVLGW